MQKMSEFKLDVRWRMGQDLTENQYTEVLNCRLQYKYWTAFHLCTTHQVNRFTVHHTQFIPLVIDHTPWCHSKVTVLICNKAKRNLECWGAWDITSGHKAEDITSSTAWKRKVKKKGIGGQSTFCKLSPCYLVLTVAGPWHSNDHLAIYSHYSLIFKRPIYYL